MWSILRPQNNPHFANPCGVILCTTKQIGLWRVGAFDPNPYTCGYLERKIYVEWSTSELVQIHEQRHVSKTCKTSLVIIKHYTTCSNVVPIKSLKGKLLYAHKTNKCSCDNHTEKRVNVYTIANDQHVEKPHTDAKQRRHENRGPVNPTPHRRGGKPGSRGIPAGTNRRRAFQTHCRD